MTILLSIVSCGKKKDISGNDSDSGNTNNNADTINVSDYLRENTPDTLPGLDFKGKTITIASDGIDATKNYELVGDDAGDVVNEAVYKRNLKVEERFNVELDYIHGSANQADFVKEVRIALTAGDDTYNIVDGVQYQMLPSALEGLYRNLSDAPYIDYSQPWWATGYMSEVEWNSDRYMLIGDISVTMLRNMSCILMNKRLYEDSFGSVDDFYNLILDGGWTYDVMNKRVTDVFQDLNGSGAADEGDIIGMGSTWASPTEHFVYTAGFKLSERDSSGKVVLSADQNRNVKIIEELYNLFYNNIGSLIYSDNNSVRNELVTMFNSGNLLFFPIRTETADALRNTKDPYGIIPYPKLDESQVSYMTLLHDAAHMFGIPVSSKNEDFEAACAVLEAMCAENYRTVTPAYYEITLKIKYTHDDISMQLIDIIRENIRTDFIYANNYALDVSGSIGIIARTIIKEKRTDYMSTYDSMKSQVEQQLKDMAAKIK